MQLFLAWDIFFPLSCMCFSFIMGQGVRGTINSKVKVSPELCKVLSLYPGQNVAFHALLTARKLHVSDAAFSVHLILVTAVVHSETDFSWRFDDDLSFALT